MTPYSDFAENVSTDVNVDYPTRENFLFQTVIKYGDREVGLAAKAKLNVVSSKQQASAYVMAMAHNKFALYGVEGKKVYGLVNDPEPERFDFSDLHHTDLPLTLRGQQSALHSLRRLQHCL